MSETLYTADEIRGCIDKKAQNVVQCLIEKNLSLSTAESCTGGLLSSAITSVPGSSTVFGCGIVSYSVEVKEDVLGVPADIIERYGVVSAETAKAMAERVMKISKSDISVGITGLAGPAGKDDPLPVGTVYIAIAYKDRITAENLKEAAENLRLYEIGSFDREINRLLTVLKVLERLEEITAGI